MATTRLGEKDAKGVDAHGATEKMRRKPDPAPKAMYIDSAVAPRGNPKGCAPAEAMGIIRLAQQKKTYNLLKKTNHQAPTSAP